MKINAKKWEEMGENIYVPVQLLQEIAKKIKAQNPNISDNELFIRVIAEYNNGTPKHK